MPPYDVSALRRRTYGCGDTALVLFSGGQDSTTCLFWALHPDFGGFGHVEALALRYGQRHEVELRQARTIADLAGISLTTLDLSGALSGSALLEPDTDVNAPHPRDEALPASFVPGRNALFLTLAASYAYTHGIRDIVGGMCQADSSGYPDCRRSFVDSQQATLSLALNRDVRLHTPLMNLTKAETWRLARDLSGAPLGHDVVEIVAEHSHTDYHGDRSERHPWGYGRLDNAASRLRAEGFEEAREKGWI